MFWKSNLKKKKKLMRKCRSKKKKKKKKAKNFMSKSENSTCLKFSEALL